MVWHLAWKECQKTHGLGILGAEGGGRLARKAEKERRRLIDSKIRRVGRIQAHESGKQTWKVRVRGRKSDVCN